MLCVTPLTAYAAYDGTTVGTSTIEGMQIYHMSASEWTKWEQYSLEGSNYKITVVPYIIKTMIQFQIKTPDVNSNSIQITVPYDFKSLSSYTFTMVTASYRGTLANCSYIDNGTSLTITANALDAEAIGDTWVFQIQFDDLPPDNSAHIYFGANASVEYNVSFDTDADSRLDGLASDLQAADGLASDTSIPDTQSVIDEAIANNADVVVVMTDIWNALGQFTIPLVLSMTLGFVGFVLALKSK